ncbi:MAG: hypothetical protein K2X87_10910 [Gemmataceae bacterium]|nr:hypothetical protein [Gemmataceae bacterium]
MDTRRGTCGSMAALYVAIGWRLGWPVGLACVKSHYFCRYDGRVTHNLEATQSGGGGFSSPFDDDLVRREKLPRIAVACGSDLRALTPRETLGVFVGFRGRHMMDTGRYDAAQRDYLLARWLFPNSRRLYLDAMGLSVPYGERLFSHGEGGSPSNLCELLVENYGWPSAGYPLDGPAGYATFTSH